MQHFLWGKVVLVLVAIVAVLQVVHLVLLSRLEARHHSRHDSASQQDQLALVGPGSAAAAAAGGGGANLQQVESMFSLLTTSLEQGRLLDAAGEFQLVPHLASPSSSRGRNPHPEPDTTLVTHCSHQHLRLLPKLLQRWQGPVSVAVYAEERDVASALWWVSRLRCCHVAVRNNVSFHLVSPLSSATTGGAGGVARTPPPWRDAADLCGTEGRMDEQDLTPNYQGQGRYPNNLLRNVARRGASTEFVMVVDIDMVPSKNLRKDFYEFAVKGRLLSESKREDKTVYVVPAFEVASSVAPPDTKRELLQLADGGKLRPFYFELCWKCQVHTDYEAWQKEPPSQGLAPLFEVLWKDPWEPFYIARNTVPFYDERFKQYGFNRISQVCELHVAGYKFSVLNNGFLVHRGLKTAASFHPSKDVEQERNRMLFRQFKVELRDKYPESSRRCY